jgi:hypothetical protein
MEYFYGILELAEKTNSNVKILSELPTSSQKRITPLGLPPNTIWEYITIQFIDDENIKITAPDNFKYKANYTEMGFKDKKKLCPNIQWKFLHFLSLRKGYLSWKSLAEERNAMKQKDIEKLINQAKKRKQLLSEKLKEYFQINEDPFYDYRKKNAYEVKFNLLPQEHLQQDLQ